MGGVLRWRRRTRVALDDGVVEQIDAHRDGMPRDVFVAWALSRTLSDLSRGVTPPLEPELSADLRDAYEAFFK